MCPGEGAYDHPVASHRRKPNMPVIRLLRERIDQTLLSTIDLRGVAGVIATLASLGCEKGDSKNIATAIVFCLGSVGRACRLWRYICVD